MISLLTHLRVEDEAVALALVRHHLMLAERYFELCPEHLKASDFDEDPGQVAWWRAKEAEYR